MEESRETYLAWLNARVREAGLKETNKDVVLCLQSAPLFLSLLLAILRDSRIPGEIQRTAASILSYFILPTDLSPEAFLGVPGVKDDIFLVALFLDGLRSRGMLDSVEKLWKGEEPLEQSFDRILACETGLISPEIAATFRKALQAAR